MNILKSLIITILLLIVCIVCFFDISKEQFESQYKPKIAVYCYNFGNFRGELNRDLDNFKKYSELDYYLFTDQDNIKSNKWNVINVNLQSRTEHMNANRVTAKYYKWKFIPNELKEYDYLVHIDAGRMRYLNKFSYDRFLEIIDDNKNYSFIGRIHPFLNNTYEECDHVLTKNADYNKNVIKWKKKLNNEKYKQNVTHIETCFFIRNLKDKELTNVLKKVYDNLIENKLCRDQLVFLYTFQQNNYDKIIAIKDFTLK